MCQCALIFPKGFKRRKYLEIKEIGKSLSKSFTKWDICEFKLCTILAKKERDSLGLRKKVEGEWARISEWLRL